MDVKIYIDYSTSVDIKGSKLPYNDAISVTAEEYEKLKAGDAAAVAALEAEKVKRIAAWTECVKNPPAVKEPTVEDMQNELASLEEQKASIEARKTELTQKVAVLEAKPVEEAIEEK